MKRLLTFLVALAVFASTLGFGTVFAADETVYIDVTDFESVTTGGWDSSDGSAGYGLTHLPTSRLIDEVVDGDIDHNTSAGFYYNVRTGYMYVDLGMEYKIHHIEVVAWNYNRPMNCSGYDLVLNKNVPDKVAYDSENHEGELLVATPDYNPQAQNYANGVRVFEVPDDGETYRYVSLEQFTDKGDRYGLTIQEVRVFVAEEDIPEPPVTVLVSEGKATGGTGIGGAWTGLAGETSNLVDGKENTETGFYANFGTKGYMYVDLGAEYIIDRIEIMAYNSAYADRAGDFDLVVSNKLPNEVPASLNPDKALVTHVGVDPNATSEAVGYKKFSLPAEIKDNGYRYISLEKLQDNSYGLLVKEIKVYVLEENLPLSFSNAEFMADGGTITMTADLTNGGCEELTFLMKAYDKNGMVQSIATETIGLSTYVVNEPFAAEIDASDIAGDDLTVDLMAVDSLENMKPVFYVENVLADERNILSFESADAELDFTAQQKGMNSEICGTAPGNPVFATLLYPDSEIAYFGYAETADGEFDFDIVMPEKAESGEYTAILGVVAKDIPIEERTKNFEFVSLIEDFENVTAENFLETAEKYSDSYPELYTLLAEKADTIGESFMLAKACLESGKVNEKITELNNSVNIKEAMRAALLIDATINGDDYDGVVAEYCDTMPLVFGEDFDSAESFEKYLNKVKAETNLNSAENIIKAYRKSLALAILSNGTRADVAEVIENYADAMDIDLEELEDAGVTINEVAKKISTSDAAIERYLKNGMGKDVDAAIESVLDDKSNKKPSGGGSGGGGGRGGSTMYPAPSVPLDVTEKTENAEDKTETAESVLYSDIAEYGWAKDAINTLAQEEIMGGIGNGKFAPNQNLTREQAAKLIVLAFDFESTMKTNKFSDCDIDEWYYPYVTAASANGIVKGITRTEFGVGSFITRQDMAVMLDRALMLKGLASGSTAHSLTDMDSVDDYAKDSVVTLAAMGIINGMEDGSFCPHNRITRAEAAVMLARILDLF